MMTLLIIEDNFDLLHLYRKAMKLVEISPEIETTGPAALRRIQDLHMDPPKAVILDLHLKREHGQEVNGEELFHVMRETWPKTKIIVVSADLMWCRQFVGVADEVVEKPIVNMVDFLRMIQGYLGRPAAALT
jgi:CheY-like chemotaxis protein